MSNGYLSFTMAKNISRTYLMTIINESSNLLHYLKIKVGGLVKILKISLGFY